MTERLSLQETSGESDVFFEIGPPRKRPKLPPHAINAKATKMAVALGDDAPPPDVIMNEIAEGNEEPFLDLMAVRKKMEFKTTKEAIISDMINKREEGEPVTDFEIELIRGLSQKDVIEAQEKGTIFETEYARNLINTYAETMADVVVDAENANADQAHDTLQRFEWAKALQTTGMLLAEELDEEIQTMGWITWAWNIGEQIIPFKTWSNLRGAVEGLKPSEFLPGNSVREQIDYLYSLNPKESIPLARQAVEKIRESNPLDAAIFAAALVTYPESDEFWENWWGIFDVGDTALVGLGIVAKGAKAARTTRLVRKKMDAANERLGEALRPLLKESREPDVVEMAEDAGHIEEAAILREGAKRRQEVFGPTAPRKAKELEESVPSIAAPFRVLSGKTHFSGAATARLHGALQRRADALLDAFVKMERVGRLTDEAETAAIEDLSKVLEERYAHVADRIHDIIPTRAEDSGPSNVTSVTLRFGKDGSNTFPTERQAKAFATRHIKPKTDDFTIEPRGKGYVIEIKRDIDETKPLIQQLLIESENVTPDSLLNLFIAYLRTPNEVTSATQTAARKVITHAPAKLQKVFKQLARDLGGVSRKDKKRLSEIMKANRDARDFKLGERGMFYENLPEFEKAWLERFGELPSEKAANAYFAFVQANDFDLVFRDYNWYRDKSVKGIELITFRDIEFEGKIVDELTRPDGAAGGVLFDLDGGTEVLRIEHQWDKIQKKLLSVQPEGHKIIQVSNANLPVPKAEAKAGNYNVTHIVTNKYKVSRIGLKNVERRPGGHKLERYPYYVKQGAISFSPSGRAYYTGDNSILNAHTLREATEVAELMDEARRMYRIDHHEWRHFVENNLPYTADEFAKLFESGRLSPDSPISATRSGLRTIDAGKVKYNEIFEDFVDVTHNPYNLEEQLGRKFAGERDVENIPILTEEGGTLKIIQDDNLLDPYTTLNHALSNLLTDVSRGDYVQFSVNSWIEEFSDVMTPSVDELRRHPMRYFDEPPYKEKVTDRARLAKAKNVRFAINNFMGRPTQFSRSVDYLKAKIAESIYGRFGAKALDNKFADWAMPTLKDPFKYMRSFAFHTKLGMFNPVQLWLQAQTLTHVMALSPRHGLGGMQAYLPTRMLLNSNMSDEMIAAHSKLLVKGSEAVGKKGQILTGGWTEEMFAESIRALDASGWAQIGGEVAVRATTETPEIVQGVWGRFLDMSPFFFNESERMLRISAWHTAYLEFRRANPGVPLRRSVRAKILSRADDMAMNMTTASNASWQRGFASVPTQFFAYQVRLMEQIFGKRFDALTRARAFAAYSFIYGVPTAATGWFAFWPGADAIRKQLFARGIEVDDTIWESFVDGVPAVVMEMMAEGLTGQEEFDLAYSQRYAPEGLPVFADLLAGRKGFHEVLFGASGSIAGDVFSSAAPAILGLRSLFSSDPDEIWPIVSEDIIDIVTNVSSGSLLYKTYVALSTGRWVTRSGITLSSEVTPIEAIIRGVSGTQSQFEADAFLKAQAIKDVNRWRQRGMREAAKEMSRAYRTDDPDEFRKYMARAKIIMNIYNLPLDNQMGAFRMSGDEDLASELAERFQKRVLEVMPAPKNTLNRLESEVNIIRGNN